MKIKNGDVIIFPTDTVYGIGALANDKLGQDKIYKIKERSTEKRLSILCSSLEDIKKIAIVTLDAEKLIKEFMPGALTIILNTKEDLINDLIHETVGVRIPNHSLALRILKENGPLATTSVNISGEAPMNDYLEILKKFGNDVTYVYPNVNNVSNVSSTVINMTVNPYKILRVGEITSNMIEKCLNK